MTEENKEIETEDTADDKKRKIARFTINVRRCLTYFLLLCISIFCCAFVTQDKGIYKAMDNTNIENIKISTFEECKEKGLHYIGNLQKRRFRHRVLNIIGNKLIIVGGLSQTQKYIKDYGEKPGQIGFDKYENNAEILNLETFNSKLIESMPKNAIYSELFDIDKNNILLMPSELEVYNIKNNKFEKLNKKNKSLYRKCIKYSNSSILCLNENLPVMDLLQIKDGALIKHYPLDYKFTVSYKQLQKSILQSDTGRIFFYYYIPDFSKTDNTIYFLEFDIKRQPNNINIYEVNLKGKIFSVHNINDNNIVFSSFSITNNENDLTNLYLYNTNIQKTVYHKILEGMYFPIYLQNGNILFYRQDNHGNINIACRYNNGTKQIEPVDINIPLKVLHPQIYPINNNQIIIIGGTDIKNGNPSDLIYIFTF